MYLIHRVQLGFQLVVWLQSISYGKSDNQPVFVEPFDLAAGGASLTRASQEGVLFSNPALMPWANKFYRWTGVETAIIFNTEAPEIAEKMSKNQSFDMATALDSALDVPVHSGFLVSASTLTNNLGVSIFGRGEFDFETKSFSHSGIPVVQANAEIYGGAIVGYGGKLTQWSSLGISVKCLAAVVDKDVAIELQDIIDGQGNGAESSPLADLEEDTAGAGNPDGCSDFSGDIGLIFFSKGTYFDLKLALKGDNFGSSFFLPGYHVGLGFTLHGTREAIHFALDYRDINNSLKEKTFKKIYTGIKILIGNYVGVAVGLYQGYLSTGIRIDAVLMQVGITRYKREYGDYLGEQSRELVVAYLATGI